MSPGIKKIGSWFVIALVAFYLITQPDAAAGAVRGIGGFFANTFESVIRFVTNVF